MYRAFGSILTLSLCACGGGDDDGTPPASEPNCVIGATLTGDVEATLSANEEAACLISYSLDSGISLGFAWFDSNVAIGLDIAEVTEGETGPGFPTEIRVTEDDRDYVTSPTGCSATITEHELEGTEMTELGELRNYRVVGGATCTEAALADDGSAGQVSLADISFHMPAVWRD